jgi:hypothetical protein
MALSTDLMGLGVSPQLASKAGHGKLQTAAGVGTDQTAAKLITSSFVNLVPTTGQTAYIMPAKPTLAKEFLLISSAAGADTALIFPPTGGKINNGTATTGSFAIAQNKSAIIWCYDNVNNLFGAIVLG